MSFFELHFSAHIPALLQEEGSRRSGKLLHGLDDGQRQRLDTFLSKNPELAEQLIKAILGSEYILESCCHNADLLFHCLLADAPFSALTPVKIFDAVETACSDELTLDELDRRLRRLRRRFMVELYWRDINKLADFAEVSQAMTAMAEAFIQQALDYHYKLLADKHGIPMGAESQQAQPMLVIGMGKLGGAELNVSSDIDLIFAFPESGKTNHANKPIDNQKFFILLGQGLIKTLNEVTADGFVFRVDMRLRPYGQSGALVSSFAALENYYQTQGRDWERFAGIKARVVACTRLSDSTLTGKIKKETIEKESTDNFYKILLPFVYRKYIDFSMIESLRQLKIMIIQEVRRKGLQDDVKLGAGGIREIEFIAQSFQLIRGGRDTRLQQRNLLVVLDQLDELNNLEEDVAEKLKEAYLFLRKTEHMLQAAQDAQTQRLPVDEQAQKILAWLLGFSSWSIFYQQLETYRQFVSATFQQVIAEPEDKPLVNYQVLPEWQTLWLELDETFDEATSAVLEQHQYNDADTAIEVLHAFKKSRNVLSLSSVAREKLDLFIPQLLHVIGEMDEPDQALNRLLKWLEAIVTRTSYVLLLLENPQVLKHLTTLFSASSWIAQTLTQMPSLLDELLYPETLYSLPEKEALRDELRQRLLRIEADDVEAHMEMLRYFRLAHNLHVAACEVAGSLPLMKVSDYLTMTAEVILEQVLQLAWQSLTQRHGYPSGVNDESPQFLVVGYGKLGGIEMSYSSDLDLVFIYDADTQGMTDGEKPLDNQTFYTRLGQKMIHILNTRTLSGQLYEVDMRLRPSGNSGLLVSSLSSYSRYQEKDAWIWEHQALVRARPVAGDHRLGIRFEDLRRAVLCLTREPEPLKAEVVKMREKMREHLGTSVKSRKNQLEIDEFHLKQDAGGIVDIEFMVQYAVLAWSHQQPALSEWTDNIRILESLQNHDLIDHQQASQLIEIYQSYRKYSHRLALQQKESSVIEGDLFAEERQKVKALWARLLN
ncbi:MAG: bifunctional [glutamate--ammonia ligase]-adenylyl-L-tyrosine phosphorylase/[glutamate--ammonia-ligase] adenylyltransferase [Cellvibrionaceae bacterium]